MIRKFKETFISILGQLSKHPLGSFLFYIAKNLYHFIVSKNHRKLFFYKSLYGFRARFKRTRISCCERQLDVPDVASFLSMYNEIFVNEIYKIPKYPNKVLDLGANIGLSVLWIKKIFPQSTVIAYEADAEIFKYLKHNTEGLEGVTINNKAVWHEDTKLSFSSEGADGGRVDEAHAGNKNIVIAVDIQHILKDEGPFDFIKMDIEGAEASVIPACRGLLGKTNFLFCEYHSIEGQKQNLDEILRIFNEEGFRIHIQPVSTSKQPFIDRHKQAGFDMQLNIFGWK